MTIRKLILMSKYSVQNSNLSARLRGNPAKFTCSNSTIETLGKGVKYVPS